MAKAIYEGVGGVARKVKGVYEGVGGVARKVKAGYIGVDGVARQFFSGEYKTLQEAYQSGAWSSCVLEWEYEKLPYDSDRFDDYTYVSTYLPSSGNILYRSSDLATTSHTDIKTNRLVYHRNVYFFCPTQAAATLFADFLSKTFTKISGYDTNKNISAPSKTISSVYCYTSVCSSAGVQIPYYEGASSITYWKAYETAGYSDKWVVRITANSSFLLAWNSDGYARDLNQITFS